MIPMIPVNSTRTVISVIRPPNCSVIIIAIGVVTDFATNERIAVGSKINQLPITKTLTAANKPPLSTVNRMIGHSAERFFICSDKGTAKATVAAPSSQFSTPFAA